MANFIVLLFKGLIFLQALQVIRADGHVDIQIEILQYDNPLGTSYHASDVHSQRKCCDGGNIPTCSSTDLCDSFFVLCIGGINNRGACNGPSATTQILNNKNSFSTSFDNTIIHSFKWDHWQSGQVQYIVGVMDKDGGSKDLVDNFTSTVALRADSSYENSTIQIMSFTDFVSLDLGIRIWCQDGYTGSDCSRHCTSKPHSVCTDHGVALLPSCSSSDVSTLQLGSTIPVNFTPYHIQQLLTKFILQEICTGAHQIDIQFLHFTLAGSVEFKASCDNTAMSSLLFTTHVYILSLTNKAALPQYFPHIPLVAPTVVKKLSSGAHLLMIIRAISYHDATSSCGQQGCNVQISVCLKPNKNGACQTTVPMQYTLKTTNWTICDGYLVDSSSSAQGHYLVSASSWPTFNVDVKYDLHSEWNSHQQPPSSYTAGIAYKQAKTVQMIFSSSDKSKTFILEAMIWCDSRHSGNHCQHSCQARGNKMCDDNGHLVCKPGYHGTSCTDINECQGQNPCKNGGTCHNTPGSFTCQCQTGWGGPFCDHDVDECALGFCTNATQCTNSPGSFHCGCQHGFRGRYCNDNDECSSPVHFCQHNSTCLNRYGSFSCLCPDGFTGNRCEQDIDECQLSLCSSHSTSCTNTVGSYSCICGAGWTGKNCENDINECTTNNPCKNGICTNIPGSYKCDCHQRYTGKHCENDIDECTSNPCNNGTCSNIRGSYKCNCHQGYTGINCDNDIDECKRNPCNNGTCINNPGSYICNCYQGYTGKLCESDFDECTTVTCRNNGTCVNLPYPAKYRCNCLSGWDPKSRCRHHTDECKALHPCVHGNCSNKNGNYICACDSGWTGKNCSLDVDECKEHPCSNNGTCTNTHGDYSCHCSIGWTGKNCTNDINECHTLNPCKNNGQCQNTHGGYTCHCAVGWTGTLCSTDINECNPHNPCKNNGKCSNRRGGYTCHCAVGWTGTLCSTDINECNPHNPCKNNGKCLNARGGYVCQCSVGWTGKNCSVDVNECNNMLHICKNGGKCSNTGGGYTCHCAVGWIGKNCLIDVNECNPHNPCKNNGTCSNTQGGYTCQCTEGWTGVNCSNDINECQNNSLCLNNGTCNNAKGGYSCMCPSNWKGNHCEVDVNECKSLPCKHNGNCSNTDGGYTCNCPENWSGDNCEVDANECSTLPCKQLGTVRLEDAIHPGCTSSGWNITLDMSILRQLYPEIKANQIYFGDNSCRGTLIGYHLVFIQGFRDCLTAERISGDTILYENELFYAIYDPIHPFIIRQHNWTYGVECDVQRNEATSSHVHHNVETHHSSVLGHYSVNMTFFKDPGYTNQLPGNPIQTNVGDDVYVKVFTTATDWSIKMRLHTCYTKPMEAVANMTYYIIKDGCEVDSNTHIISQSTHETRFVFQDFEYSTNREGLNIYCNATFCETKDYSPGCAQSCISSGSQALIGK